MSIDPHATALFDCPGCGHVHEDLAVAVAELGGWCTCCDQPVSRIAARP